MCVSPSLAVSPGRTEKLLRCRRPRFSTIHRLTDWKTRPAVIYRLPSIPPSVVRVRRLSHGLRSAVRRPYSFIRSPFVDGSPYRSRLFLPDRISL